MPVRKVSEAALRRLKNHGWPGNVRELENTIQRAMVLSEGDGIEEADIVLGQMDTAAPMGHPAMQVPVLDSEGRLRPLKACEDDIMRAALRYHDGNVTQAAKDLGIAKSTLYRRLDG